MCKRHFKGIYMYNGTSKGIYMCRCGSRTSYIYNRLIKGGYSCRWLSRRLTDAIRDSLSDRIKYVIITITLKRKETNMQEMLQAALEEYYEKRSDWYPKLQELSNGLFAPPKDDRCHLCKDAQWSCTTGAHLKTVEHIAFKHQIAPKLLIKCADQITYRASDIGWKQVRYTPNSYLRSHWDSDFVWLPGEVLEATCHNGTCDNVPNESCMCGFYFFWSPFAAREYYSDEYVTIRCNVGGKVIEATKGCRAQYATVTGILVNGNREIEKEMSELDALIITLGCLLVRVN